MILSKEQLLASNDCEVSSFQSKVWGGEVKFRPPTQADKAAARRLATRLTEDGKAEIDQERLEAAIVVRCLVEPRLEEADVQALMQKNGNEIKRLVRAILGDSQNPTR